MTTAMKRLSTDFRAIFEDRLFWAASLAHMMLDIFNSAGPILVAFISVAMGLDNTQVGLAIGLYQFAGAIGQPLFGWLADKYGDRGAMGLSVGWTIGFLLDTYNYLNRPLPQTAIDRLRHLVDNDVSADVRVEAVMALAGLGLADQETVDSVITIAHRGLNGATEED